MLDTIIGLVLFLVNRYEDSIRHALGAAVFHSRMEERD
jgi:hypothetical protein